MILVFRCANGLALFHIQSRPGGGHMRITCLNDGSTAQLPRLGPQWEAVLVQIHQKAVSLRGAIQSIFVLPFPSLG